MSDASRTPGPLSFGVSCPAPIRTHDRIALAHGSGGLLSAQLIDGLILPALHNPILAQREDQAVLPLPGGARLAFTTDSFVVTPRFFPGGDIGELAVNGTINDLAMGGARPLALSLALILEEGLPMAELERVIASIRRASERAGVPIVTGDTKVVARGDADGLFINTSGVGLVHEGRTLGAQRVQPTDAILVSGTLGDHGITIVSQREGLSLEGELQSDTAPLHELSDALLSACPGVHALRDPTRGGLAAVLSEIARASELGMEIEESALPIADAVRGACELFGIDPMLVANEGKLVAFVAESEAERALQALRSHPLGQRAARIGTVTREHRATTVVHTGFGSERVLDLPLHEPLPRIC